METCPCVPGRIGIWKCWFLRRGETGEPEGKVLGAARERTKNKLNPHMASTPGFGALTTAPPSLLHSNLTETFFLIDTLRFSVDIWTKMIVVILNRVDPPVETTCYMRLRYQYTKTIFFSYQNIIVEFSR